MANFSTPVSNLVTAFSARLARIAREADGTTVGGSGKQGPDYLQQQANAAVTDFATLTSTLQSLGNSTFV